jgi:PleD family two-component response regulator
MIKINKQKIWQLIDSSHAFTRNLLNILLERVCTANNHFDDSMQVQHEMTIKATRDALTGLYNRRLFDNNLGLLLPRCIESETPFPFVMLDIDHI